MLDKNVILDGKAVLVTGAAGFIGCNLCKKLLNDYDCSELVGLDSITDYYDVNIKHERLKEIEALATSTGKKWTFVKANLADKAAIDSLFEKYHFAVVVNLAAQAGVRYSITNPDAYIQSNLIGFYNILEACRRGAEKGEVEHLVYASSSSVYGSNKKIPYSTDDKVDNPVSLYAATKKSNELMAHAYSKLYNIPSTGLRFFTVYGPAGRPDMAYFGFTNKLKAGKTIQIFNYGKCPRLRDNTARRTRPRQSAPRRLRLRSPQGTRAHATRRRARHLRRHIRPRSRLRLQARHPPPRRPEKVRGVVCRVLRKGRVENKYEP